MPRRNFLLSLAYDGSGFSGWQRGPEASRTVQAEVEAGLSKLLGEAIEVTGASRTDAGVHAEGQAASFHSRTGLQPERIVAGLNGIFPPDLACRRCREVDPRFHARYRAKGKLYRYRLHTAALPDPFESRYSLHVESSLDLGAMEKAAAALEKGRDFSAFTNAKKVEDGCRRLDSVRVEASEGRVDLLFKGESFLYNQVRIMAAALLEAGKGSLDAEDIARALESGDRGLMPGTLGPFGLCLVEVYY
jgi:tRNA pseudouridine38-40 synthase